MDVVAVVAVTIAIAIVVYFYTSIRRSKNHVRMPIFNVVRHPILLMLFFYSTYHL